MSRLRFFLPVLVLSLVWVGSARADTLRVHVTVDPPYNGSSGWLVNIADDHGYWDGPTSQGAVTDSIPRTALIQSGGDFRLIDHDQPSSRGFCVSVGWASGQQMLRPTFAAASAAPSATVTVTDPDGTSRTVHSTVGLGDPGGAWAVTPATTAECPYEPIAACPVAGASPAPQSGGGPPLLGTSGADKLDGTPGVDCINGEDGDDRLDGKAGEDVVDGGPGNDYVVGGADRDVLKGGDGRDLLSDGLGANTYDAGPGDDVVSARQSIGEQVDCGEGKDLAIVDRKDTVVNCERVERPSGHAQGQPDSAPRRHSKRAAASAVRWPAISAGWWHLPSDSSENWAYRKTSENPNGLTCFAAEESMLAGLVGVWNGGSGNQRRIELQFRWIDISPAQFASLAWWQRMGQAVESPEHKSPWTGMRQFYSTYNWRQRLPAGASRWVQYRVKWVVDAGHDKVAATDWMTMGECDGA